MKTHPIQSIEQLKSAIRGRIVRPDDGNYNDLIKIWNAMIDRHPAVIVQCAHPEDVPQAIKFARSNGYEISIRGAGHNIAGNAVCDGGVMIDFSTMKAVEVNPSTQRAYVQPGATLGIFDRAVQAHGLATPIGINSSTGIAGLTLGGGFGWLTRQYGMTIDNLISTEIITADGQALTASATANPDLFWAIRGGGGNFGVVTQFEFQLHPVGPEIFAGLIVFPLEEARAILEQYRRLVKTAPEALNIWAVMRKAPPLPFLDASVHGRWQAPEDDDRCIDWARALYNATTPYASAGTYINFMTRDEGDRVAAAYGPNYDRLLQIKRKYDSENVFHLNQNIDPRKK
jgi:FAD/FMN-containing dehydrogenase